MLFKHTTLKAIAERRVTVAFRRWQRPTVRAGGTLVTAVGVLAIDAVEKITLSDITHEDATAAGHRDVAELTSALTKRRGGRLYRIAFHLAGADPRIALRTQTQLTAAEVGDLRQQLARFKTNVRKLKSLGLTESLEVGYRLSPRGKAVLRVLE